MASTSEVYPSSWSSVGGTGNSWTASVSTLSTDCSSVTDSNANGNCLCSSTASNNDYLQGTNLGISITSSATIDGIQAVLYIQGYGFSGFSESRDETVKLIVAGSKSGTNKGSLSNLTPYGTWITKTYGSSSDKWGLSLTGADVNASNFGIAYRGVTSSGSARQYVDGIGLTIWYTLSSGLKLVTKTGMAQAVNRASRY